jgi:hypothetical protein
MTLTADKRRGDPRIGCELVIVKLMVIVLVGGVADDGLIASDAEKANARLRVEGALALNSGVTGSDQPSDHAAV